MPPEPAASPGRLPPEAAGARTGELYAEHGRMVYGLARLLLRDPVEAEDAAQQTFLSAHKSLLSGTEPRDPGAWLATIARNECGARSKARMREPLPLGGDEPVSAGGPHEALELRLETEALRAALLELPEKQREAIVLRHLYGLDYREVGVALGLSLPAVESVLFRARRRLQVRLKPAAAALTVPLAVQEGLAQALPGFATAASGGGGVAAGLGLLAKLGGTPLVAKLAAASVAATVAGTAVVATTRPSSTPPARGPSTSPAAVTASGATPSQAGSSAPAATIAASPRQEAKGENGGQGAAAGHSDKGATSEGDSGPPAAAEPGNSGQPAKSEDGGHSGKPAETQPSADSGPGSEPGSDPGGGSGDNGPDGASADSGGSGDGSPVTDAGSGGDSGSPEDTGGD
jgi:RNA polymerase sigma-70 factor (ECF subfamily)